VFYNNSDQQIGASAYGVCYLCTGQQWRSEIGLYDLRNLFYSPDIGRFLQPDPIDFAGDPTNLYRYCRNKSSNVELFVEFRTIDQQMLRPDLRACRRLSTPLCSWEQERGSFSPRKRSFVLAYLLASNAPARCAQREPADGASAKLSRDCFI